MATYISLANLTDDGVKGIKELPDRLKGLEQGIQQAGGKLIGWYLTMGQYDAVVIAEFPDDQAAVRTILSVAGQGRVRTTTMKAFTRQEAEAIARSMP